MNPSSSCLGIRMGGGRPEALFFRLFLLLLFAPSSPPPAPPSDGVGEAPLIDAAAPSEEPNRSLEVGDPVAFPVSKPDVVVVAPSVASVGDESVILLARWWLPPPSLMLR